MANPYYQLTVPEGEDPRAWAEEHWRTYDFDYEAWERAPAAREAIERGQLIFWPLETDTLDRLASDGIVVELLQITAKDLYG